MSQDTHVYSDVKHETDLKKIFEEIRQDVDKAESRRVLTELYRRVI